MANWLAKKLADHAIVTRAEDKLIGAKGWNAVKGAILRSAGSERRLDVDAIAIGTTRRPAIELAQQAGARDRKSVV